MYEQYPLRRTLDIPLMHTLFIQDYPEDYDFPGEFHDFWECVLVLRGELSASGDRNVYRLQAGDILFHKPMEIHRFHVDSVGGARLLIFSFHMTGEDTRCFENQVATLNSEQMGVVRAFLSYLQAHESDGADRLPQSILSSQRRDAPNVAMIVTYITQLFLLLRSDDAPPKPSYPTEAAPFTEAVGYLESHINESVRIEELAHTLGISVSGLKRLFRRYADMGVHEYFVHLKLRHAVLLLQKGYRVTEVALRLGFSSQAHFSRVFSRAMGYAPSKVEKI